jgi:hypothetical protein
MIKFIHALIESIASIKSSNHQIILKIVSKIEKKEKKNHKKEFE